MTHFLLILRADPVDYTDVSPEQLQALIQRFDEWAAPLLAAGQLKDGKKLGDGTGRVLAKAGGAVRVKDGPYGETKELVGGFHYIVADDFDAAVELCRNHPNLDFSGGSIEIREVDWMGHEPPPE